MKKILVEKTHGYKVYQVDGHKVRDLSPEAEEFGESGFHQQFSFIPENEIWLENNVKETEIPVLIDMIVYQIRLIKSGVSETKAYKRAILYEKKLREERFNTDNWEGNTTPKGKAIEKIGWLKGLISGVNIYMVDGKAVRDRYKTDFMEGGHGYVYKWIPNSEIWIESGMGLVESLLVLIHEVYERSEMKGSKISYDKAHKKAAKLEFDMRKMIAKLGKAQQIVALKKVIEQI